MKEVLGKCIYESVNRAIHDRVMKEIVREEQTYSKQPMLLAHPSSVKAMKGGIMGQISEGFKEFMVKGYMSQKRFIEDEKVLM